MGEMIDWAALARNVARNSQCHKPNRNVGAVLVRRDPLHGDVLVSIGTNGPPPGAVCTWAEGKDTSCLHAEQAALMLARGQWSRLHCYITREPCTDLPCRAMLERYGVTWEVV